MRGNASHPITVITDHPAPRSNPNCTRRSLHRPSFRARRTQVDASTPIFLRQNPPCLPLPSPQVKIAAASVPASVAFRGKLRPQHTVRSHEVLRPFALPLPVVFLSIAVLAPPPVGKRAPVQGIINIHGRGPEKGSAEVP